MTKLDEKALAAVAAFLKLRDESITPDEADDDERWDSAIAIVNEYRASLPSPEQSAAQQPATEAVEGWKLVPIRPTATMILAAAEAHYGKARVARSGGPKGIAMTVEGIDYTFDYAFRRFWKGAISQSPSKPAGE